MVARASVRPRRLPRRPRRHALLAAALAGAVLLFVVNGLYQVVRKPTELLAPVSPALAKDPRATWEAYGPLFEAHSTRLVTADLLAALAQAEGAGNPLARPAWRWRLALNPFEIYRPASSAVGMFQITDGTYAEASAYCIHAHEVARTGPWHDLGACWFNGLYSRLVPSHAIEMTAAYLHQTVVDTLARRRVERATLAQSQDLAAVIHLCGAARGEAFVRRGFRAGPGERCGEHDLGRYVGRVNRLKRQFARLRLG